jgi:spermidine/putrescine transport system substrate-binding protein
MSVPPASAGTLATLKAARRFTRRTLLARSLTAGTALGLGPWVVRDARSSSGELNILHWPDEVPKPIIPEFTKKTGIKVNATPFSQNEELINKLQATGGEGCDACQPSRPLAPQYRDIGVLAPWDTTKLNLDRLLPSMLTLSTSLWTWDGKLYHVPHCWGSEAIAWRTDLTTLDYTSLSYGALWDEQYRGKVQGRPWSLLLTIGLWMDHSGQLPSNRMFDTFTSPDRFKAVYDKILPFAIAHKPWIKQFWDSGDSTISGFMENGCVVGETWDGPALRLKKQGKPVSFMAPQEGAITWMDGWSLTQAARNIPQAYEWINFLHTPDVAAMGSNGSGYNPVVKGAEDLLTPLQKTVYLEAYPDDALSKVWTAMPSAPWYLDLRAQYADKFKAA